MPKLTRAERVGLLVDAEQVFAGRAQQALLRAEFCGLKRRLWDGEDVRDRMEDILLELEESSGPSLRDVCREYGLGETTIYAYFRF